MPRAKCSRLLVFLGVPLLGAGVLWMGWVQAHRLAPGEAAVVGTWLTPLQPDGFSTVILLRPDRTCRVRWLDGAGKDTKPGHPPREGRWWVNGASLFVDVSLQPSWLEDSTQRRTKRAALAWPFAIQEETLVLGPQTNTPVTLRRKAGTLP